MEEFADFDDLDMEIPVDRVLEPGTSFSHEYDFGDTTELRLRVVSEGYLPEGADSIRVLARNDPPAFPCVRCDAPAARICIECAWNGEGFRCLPCQELHLKESPSCEDMFLPVVNSPRIGQCDYNGPMSGV